MQGGDVDGAIHFCTSLMGRLCFEAPVPMKFDNVARKTLLIGTDSTPFLALILKS